MIAVWWISDNRHENNFYLVWAGFYPVRTMQLLPGPDQIWSGPANNQSGPDNIWFGPDKTRGRLNFAK